MAIRLNLGSLSNKITLSGLLSTPAVFGGTLYSDAVYSYRAFTSSDTLTITGGSLKADILVVAGGGSGAWGYAGGAGAGGLLSYTSQKIAKGTYSVVIGAGAAQASTNGYNPGNTGNNTYINNLTSTAYGGGYGAYFGNRGGNGGSGGGGGWFGASGGSGTPGQGYDGGNGGYGAGGGGGGAAGAASGEFGGPGSSNFSSWASVTGTGVLWNGSYYYAAGADSEHNNDTSYGKLNTPLANTGSGSRGNSGSGGGSGIVILRYPTKSAISADSSLIYITINGTQYSISDLAGISNTINIPYGQTSANISVTKSNKNASVVINGASGFSVGNNTTNIVVTAQDKVTTTTYSLTFNVAAPSTDSSLGSVSINGNTYTYSQLTGISSTVSYLYGTSSVNISAVPGNQYATVASITGTSGLSTGNNTVNIVIQAQDGSTTTYPITVVVQQPSNDSSLSSVTIAGTTYSLSDLATLNNVIQLSGTPSSVSVVATPTSQYATVSSITGNTGLSQGTTNLSITIQAQDLSTTTYNYTLYIPSTVVVSGGVLTSDSTYFYRTFNSTDNLVVSNGELKAQAILIAGGGGAQYGSTGSPTVSGGGGGAGGLLENFALNIPSGSYTVTVGSGGPSGTNGNDTTLLSMSAFGGGLGAYRSSPGGDGGSGGGAGGNGGTYWAGGSSTQTSNGGGTGYGNPGFAYDYYASHWDGSPGGGSGSGSTGRQYSDWASATSTGDSNGYYAGGGDGGRGGGGAGNSAQGGGGSSRGNNTGNGGIVIIRYNKLDVAPLPTINGGGTVTSDSTYYYRTFTDSDTFITTGTLSVDVLLVGAGGGAGGYGGGGGAGGVINFSSVTLHSGTHYAFIGAGGAGGGAWSEPSYGNPTHMGSLLPYDGFGGGYGGGYASFEGYYSPTSGLAGASGGGANWATGSAGGAIPEFGQIGGNGGYGYQDFGGGAPRTGGGGGGAGGNAIPGGTGGAGAGGPGTSAYSSWLSAISSTMSSVSGWNDATSNGYIAGGGGGAAGYALGGGGGGAGGAGGGGAGSGSQQTAQPGTTNTGSGAGSNGADINGLNGGSGLIIVRYTKSQVDA